MLNIENIFPDSTAEILKGGKPAMIGEIREFGGKKYKKTPNGWRPVPKKESVAKESKEESTTSSVSKIIDGFKSINSKYSDRDKMSLERTDSGNWHLYYDGKDTGTVMNKDIISEVNAKKRFFNTNSDGTPIDLSKIDDKKLKFVINLVKTNIENIQKKIDDLNGKKPKTFAALNEQLEEQRGKLSEFEEEKKKRK